MELADDMATKVNTKFVIVMAAVAAAGLIGLAVVGNMVLNKPPQAHIDAANVLIEKGKATRATRREITPGMDQAQLDALKLANQDIELAANKDLEAAVKELGKAVSKDQNNLSYLNQWVAAMELTRPPTRQLYFERYDTQYVRGLQRIADTQPPAAATPAEASALIDTRIAAYRRLLEPGLYSARLSPGQGAWNGLISAVDIALKRFAERDEKKEYYPKYSILARYRGIARVGLLKVNFEVNDTDRELARKDLEAALAADPGDTAAMTAMLEWTAFAAQRARAQAGRDVEAQKMVDDVRARATAFIDANKPAAAVEHAMNLLDFQEQLRQVERREAAENDREARKMLVAEFKGRADQTLASFEATKVDRIDPLVLAEAVNFALNIEVPDALTRGLRVMEDTAKARSDDPFLLFQMGKLAAQAKEFDKAVEIFGTVRSMKDRTLSFQGKILFILRDMSLVSQARAVLSKLEFAKVDEDMTGVLDKAKAYADEIDRLGKGDAEMAKSHKLIMGRIMLQEANSIRRELAGWREKAVQAKAAGQDEPPAPAGTDLQARERLDEARKLLSTYSDQVNRQDPEALGLLMAVHAELQNYGAMIAQIEQLQVLGRDNFGTDKALASAHVKLGDLPRAAQALRRAAFRAPSDQLKKETEAELGDIEQALAPTSADAKALDAIRKLITAPIPDEEKIVKAIDALAAGKVPESVNSRIQIGSLLARFSTAEALRQYISKMQNALGLSDQEQSMVRLKAMLEPARSVEEVIRSIDEQTGLTAAERLVAKYTVYDRASRLAETPALSEERRKLAEEQFAALEKLDDKHPLVVSVRFEKAISEGKFDQAAVFATAAGAQNLDRAKGKLFDAQLSMARSQKAAADGKADEAKRFLADAEKQAAEAADSDKDSAFPWRVLGMIRQQSGNLAEAIVAVNRAYAIRPNDVMNVRLLAQLYQSNRQYAEALRVLRESRSRFAGDPEFINYVLAMETAYGGPEGARTALEQRARMFKANPAMGSNTGPYFEALLRSADVAGMQDVVDRLAKEPNVNPRQVGIFRFLYLCARSKLAQTAEETKTHLDAALAEFEKTISGVPEDARNGSDHLVIAQEAFSFGFPEAALAVAESGLKYQRAGETSLDRMIGDVYFGLGVFDKAAAAYQRALDAATKDDNSLLAFRLADSLLRLRKGAEADAILAKITPGASTRLNLLLLRSQAQQQIGKLKESLTLATEAVTLDPKSPLPLIRRAEVLLSEADPAALETSRAGVLADLAKVLDLGKGDQFRATRLAARKLLATVYFTDPKDPVGGQRAAIKVMRDALTEDPDNDRLRMDMVQDFLKISQPNDALEVLLEGIDRPGDDRQWLAVAGDIYIGMDRWTQAAEMFKRLWDLEKKPVIAERYVTALLTKSPAETAVARAVLADKAANTDASFGLILLRARASVIDGREAEAARDARAAWSQVDINSLPAVNAYFAQLLRQVFRKQGDDKPRLGDAIRFIESLRPAGGFNDTVEFALANIRLGDEKSRTEAMQTLVKLGTSAKEPVVRYQALRVHAGEMMNSGKYAEALADYREAEKLSPESFENLNDLAFTLSRYFGKHEEALPLAEKASQAAPTNVFVQGTLGTVYLGLSRYKEAGVALDRALRVAANPVQRAGPLVRLIQLAQATGDNAAARNYLTVLDEQIKAQPVPGQIEKYYKEELEAFAKNLRNPS